MALWTDIIDPAELSGYARQSFADYEASKGTTAQWLPNRYVPDIVVRFTKGGTGLVETARFRAYDAEPEFGKRYAGERVTLELPALGITFPVTELEQLRARNGANVSDEDLLTTILGTTDAAVRSMADRMEHLRGIVLATGKATINQENFKTDDDFGRPSNQQVTASTLWTDTTVSRLDYIRTLVELMEDANGERPEAMVGSSQVWRALAKGDEFRTSFEGYTRAPSRSDVDAILVDHDLPPFYVHDRRVNLNGTTTRSIPSDRLLLLPAPVEPNAWEATELGATFWGRTLTADDPSYGIAPGDQSGIVVGAWKNDRPPFAAEVIGDAIGLPVLANANLSFKADVL